MNKKTTDEYKAEVTLFHPELEVLGEKFIWKRRSLPHIKLKLDLTNQMFELILHDLISIEKRMAMSTFKTKEEMIELVAQRLANDFEIRKDGIELSPDETYGYATAVADMFGVSTESVLRAAGHIADQWYE